MIFKIALVMWVAAFLVGVFTGPTGRTWIARLALGGFCLMLLAALIRLLRL